MARREFYDVGILALDRALMEGGERASLARVIIDAAGKCERPVGFEHVYTRPLGTMRGEARNSCSSMILTGDARCRRCATCRALRARLWTFRALQEVRAAPGRTWFGTLTLCSAERTRILSEARQYCERSGVDFDAQDAQTQFGDLVRQLGQRLTRYLKRLRRTGAVFRYLFVVERHQSGDPHMHCLLHEHGNEPVPKALLETQWQTHGFSAWRLIPFEDTGAAFYCCKYLSKEVYARVRASTRYGEAGNLDSQRSVNDDLSPRAASFGGPLVPEPGARRGPGRSEASRPGAEQAEGEARTTASEPQASLGAGI